jgi:hypothetical protein
VLGELLIGPLQARLVPARNDDAALELIADQGGRDAADEGEGALVAGDPVRDLLGQGRLGVGVVRGAEDGDEQLDRDPLAGGGVDEGGEPASLVATIGEATLGPETRRSRCGATWHQSVAISTSVEGSRDGNPGTWGTSQDEYQQPVEPTEGLATA